MSQSATWDTMQVARDARLCGRLDVAAALQGEIDEDLPAYSHLYARRTSGRYWPGVTQASPDFLEWTGTHIAARRASQRSVPVASNEAYRAFGARQRRGTDTDAIEMRIGSYANIIVPAWYGVITVDQ